MIKSISNALGHFHLSNESKSEQLDGQRQAFVLPLSSARILNLADEIPSMAPAKCLGIALAISSLIKLIGISAFQKAFPRDTQGYILLKVSDFLDAFDLQTNKLGDCIDSIINIASSVCYIGMIFFGYTSAGIIGLSGLMLIYVKQSGYLPAKYDSSLRLSGSAIFVYNIINCNVSIFRKIPLVFLSLFSFVNRLSKYHFFYSYFLSPFARESFTEPDNSLTLDSFIQSNENHAQAFEDLTFVINPRSFQTKKEVEILPIDFEKDLKQISIEALYQNIEQKQKDCKFSFTTSEGWKRLKNGILKKRIEDDAPPNVDKLIDYLKGVLFLCSKESMPKDKFESTMKELANIGDQCHEGWVRDIGFLLDPKSRNYEWFVHHSHALFRGALVKESIQKALTELTENLSDEERQKQFSSLGGANGVHFNNHIQLLLAHRWHTYDAQVHFSIEGQSLMQRLLRKNITRNLEDPFPKDFLENLFVFLNRTYLLPKRLYSIVNQKTYENYTSENLVSMLYEKMKPQYRQTKHNALEVFREIEWQTIQSWLQTINQKGFQIMDDEGNYNPPWVESDLAQNLALTKKGVQLLLWDLGVLKP